MYHVVEMIFWNKFCWFCFIFENFIVDKKKNNGQAEKRFHFDVGTWLVIGRVTTHNQSEQPVESSVHSLFIKRLSSKIKSFFMVGHKWKFSVWIIFQMKTEDLKMILT